MLLALGSSSAVLACGESTEAVGAGGAGTGGNSSSATGGGSATGGVGGDAPTPPAGDWTLDDSAPPDDSQPSWPSIVHPQAPTAFWGELKGPYPTNTWWLSLVLADGTGSAFPFPFTLSWSNAGISFGHPDLTSTENAVFAPLTKAISLGASEAFDSRVVSAYDELSVTLRFHAVSGTMSVPVVAGVPYMTAVYDGLTPKLGLSISGTGTRFAVNAAGVDYVVYTSSSVTFSGGVASAPFSGWVRIAKLPVGADAGILDEHASAVVYGGTASFAANGKTGIMRLSFDTHGSDTPLVLALPHHLERLVDADATKQAFSLTTLKGVAQAISADHWDIQYPMTDVSFTATSAIDPNMLGELQTALTADSSYDPAAQDDASVYWSGKALSKLARLVQIADEIGDTATRDLLLGRLRSKEKAWLDGTTTATELAYDTTWGGVVNECVTTDQNCDFGQGLYSDHHFHYGYHVFASAVIAKYDATFASDYRQKVEWLIRDYANPYRNDPHFARLRHFDVYHGHSWTSGLIVFGDGRNQESTSEAVNSYYGLQLWGEATGNEDLAKFGHILRIAESVGAQDYWHVKGKNPYGAPFDAHPCVGIVWGSKVDYATWFGTGDHGEFVCGIQMIPVTPATEDLLDKAWLDEVWDSKLGPIAGALALDNGWRDFYAAARANQDRAAGCAMIEAQTAHDDGNSRTNMLHYCATRPH